MIMIRNNRKLLQAEQMLVEAQSELDILLEKYTGIDRKLYATPLRNTIEDLEIEITEYKELIESSFEDSMKGVLKKPSLLGNIGELLTKLRIAKGITQAEMAERLGWQQSNLSRFESTNYGSHTIAKILEYSAELDVWLYVAPKMEEVEEDLDLFNSNLDNLVGLGVLAAEQAVAEFAGETSSINNTEQILRDLYDKPHRYELYSKDELPKRSTKVPKRTRNLHFRENQESEINKFFAVMESEI